MKRLGLPLPPAKQIMRSSSHRSNETRSEFPRHEAVCTNRLWKTLAAWMGILENEFEVSCPPTQRRLLYLEFGFQHINSNLDIRK